MQKGTNRRRAIFSVLMVFEIIIVTLLMGIMVYKRAEQLSWNRMNDAVVAVNNQFSEKMNGEKNALLSFASVFHLLMI